jgi:hypothetical protein
MNVIVKCSHYLECVTTKHSHVIVPITFTFKSLSLGIKYNLKLCPGPLLPLLSEDVFHYKPMTISDLFHNI